MKENLNIPNHVGIILDGNGRWAEEKGLPRSKGHEEGYKTLKKLGKYILSTSVKYLSIFAFSTENFKRSEKEVNFLMDLFAKKLMSDKEFFKENNIKVLFSGREKPLRKDVLNTMEKLAKYTENNTGGVFNICINYGGQSEIVDLVKKISKDKTLDIDSLTEEDIYSHLYNELPPIDLLIRTSGEQRISNFMLYQIAYAELYFPKTYFPDFLEKEFDEAILEFNNRNRRFGGYNKKDVK